MRADAGIDEYAFAWLAAIKDSKDFMTELEPSNTGNNAAINMNLLVTIKTNNSISREFHNFDNSGLIDIKCYHAAGGYYVLSKGRPGNLMVVLHKKKIHYQKLNRLINARIQQSSVYSLDAEEFLIS
ncbi:hypothetical protein [Sodalis endosymbiont of Henestaris halophilus]|uniref:hypothetical protein n=1 Tax=Sodalis endosymbiont of Henestaris halophilus TaxID=1929246 RepID=UPI000BE32FB1|nr:hypothetical protein [Sodalis endosymbiont of Henestaris halophilus]